MSPTTSKLRGGAAGQSIVSLTNLTKNFATREGGEHPVLEGITLEIKPGEIVALLGKSGSGKSTILRCIAGLIDPSGGERPPADAEIVGVEPTADTDSDQSRYSMIPHASVDGIAGLAELAGEAPPDTDLGDLAAIVGFEIDDLLPLVDALALLDFARINDNHLELTESGRRFAIADIQVSKELFRRAALARVPLVRRIHRALQHSNDGALGEGLFMDLLNRHFSPEEARAQLDTAIVWGRYAELFEYDANRGGQISLPEAAGLAGP